MAPTRPPEAPKSLGHYDLLREVGGGSMGTVYRAQHRDTKEIVALKIVAPEVVANPIYRKRFEQECRVASRLKHPSIVRAIEYNPEGASPYLVMEFIEGESLGDKLDRERRLSEPEAVELIVQVARGLQVAHEQGLIHRDIKPDNILVAVDGKAKITDLGLVKDIDTMADLTRPGSGLGTPAFMAPEQFKNARNASVRCDVYSLGATLYQMVTGVIPFDGCDVVQTMMRKLRNDLSPPRALIPTLSQRTDATIRRAMSVSADQRPASCLEFVENLLGPAGLEQTSLDHAADTLTDLQRHTPMPSPVPFLRPPPLQSRVPDVPALPPEPPPTPVIPTPFPVSTRTRERPLPHPASDKQDALEGWASFLLLLGMVAILLLVLKVLLFG